MTVAARLALLSAIAALATGCTNLSSGTAVLPPGSDATPTGSAPTTTSEPARPRQIRLNGKEPCALVPQADWPKFDIEEPGTTRQDPVFKSPKCSYDSNTGGAEVTLVLTEGIGRWTDGSRRGEAHQIEPIQGFPAITVTLPSDKDSCDVAVDVADGQYLYAAKIVISTGKKTLPAPCDWARQLAESAMKTLVAS